MDHYSILDPSPPAVPPETSSFKEIQSGQSVPERLNFPGDDGGKSLTEMARRDLDATLQLLAERAQYITGASGAAIALREHNEMICRASAGASAPEIGAALQMNSGLTGESARTRQILRCDNAETDARVNRESCRALEIASVVVMPLLQEEEVVGVFELLSSRASAFEERDITALQRLGEMILTALDHAEAAERAEKELTNGTPLLAKGAEEGGPSDPAPESSIPQQPLAPELKPPEAARPLTVRKCESCGFPVSEGRTICLDCEAAQDAAGTQLSNQLQLSLGLEEEGWLASHKYLIAVMLLGIIVAFALCLR